MNREYHCWHSHRLNRNMELLVFGHAGAKVLMFPSRDGRFYEYENMRIVEKLAHKIKAGQLQLFCVDNLVSDTLYCKNIHPADRINRHIQFEEYILNEVMPLMSSKNPHPCTISFGCSLGAYQAINIAFRHPHLFKKVSAFSGRYDLTCSPEHFHNLFEGYYDESIYYHTPNHFLPRLNNAHTLQHLRNMDIILTIGRDDPFIEDNRYLSSILNENGIAHKLHIWDGRAHSGYYWRRMAQLYI